MPIEIKELHISVTVDAGPSNDSAATGATPPLQSADMAQASRENLIAECVEQVLRILEQKRER